MKSKEELNAFKDEAEAMNKNLTALNEEELEQVSGGITSRTVTLYSLKAGEWFHWPKINCYFEVMGYYMNVEPSARIRFRAFCISPHPHFGLVLHEKPQEEYSLKFILEHFVSCEKPDAQIM